MKVGQELIMDTTQTTQTNKILAEFEIAIRIRHPTIDPKEITSHLCWEPSYSYMVGEPRTTPKGNSIDGINKETFWYVELATATFKDIRNAIESTNNRLIGHKKYLEELVISEGKIEYFIGWFIENNASEKFPWKLLQECSELRIDLVLDVYGEKL